LHEDGSEAPVLVLSGLRGKVAVCIIVRIIERDSRKIIQRLNREGWVPRATAGSHHQYVKGSARVTVPHPKKDLPLGTARQMARAAGWISGPDREET
jgi:predicted RNA binding protein YcfA (HicA-like mRNA interferase family)